MKFIKKKVKFLLLKLTGKDTEFIKRKTKFLLLKLTGKFNYLKKTIKVKHKWYGNNYGGFYICPEFINENSIIYSFGIGEDISFDTKLINIHNCNVFGFDPTPKSIKWVKSQKLLEKFKFYEYGISNHDEFVNFYLPANPNHVSGSIVINNNINRNEKVRVEMKSIKSILNQLKHKHIDILKMDIEGAEYDVLDNILSKKNFITQIVVEFHERFFKNGKEKTISMIKKMNKHGYEVFGISDTFEEISFINKNVPQHRV